MSTGGSEGVLLGIDTSNYTTSVALLTEDGQLLANIKRPLPVRPGERGLRQSEAVFAHVKNLPSAMEEAQALLQGRRLLAIGVSTRPRNVDGSYMPCFLVGEAAATSAACAAGVPLYRFSHQCGHVMAALYSSGREELMREELVAFHVSGGTTEVLHTRFTGAGFATERIGGTRDINAGQLIDRVGVYMGLPFPAGAPMEQLASRYQGRPPRRRIRVEALGVNLSGVENLATRLYDDTQDRELVSAFVLDTVGEVLASLTREALAATGVSTVVYAGGVMSNGRIRARLAREFPAAFATRECSSDNAVGIAALARAALAGA